MPGGFKGTFFDTEAVRRQLDGEARKWLSKFGRFVQRRAQTSIRKRKAAAPPGSPPSGHAGTLRKGILFGYDLVRRSVVIGPARLGPASGAPEALEKGGRATVVRGGARAGRQVTVKPRPFMAPAFKAELPNFQTCVR